VSRGEPLRKENKTTTLKEGYKLDLGEALTSSVIV